jgi:hypothetical protein
MSRAPASLHNTFESRAITNLEKAVRAAATKFRTILSVVDKSSLPVPWQNFPYGSCDPASQVLGRFLHETLGINVMIVYGERDFPSVRNCTHRWLECDGLIVDVTADQFGQDPIIVTRDSTWHKDFRHIKRESLAADDRFAPWCAIVLEVFKKFASSNDHPA